MVFFSHSGQQKLLKATGEGIAPTYKDKKDFFSQNPQMMIMKMVISSQVGVLLTFSTTSSITFVNRDTNPIYGGCVLRNSKYWFESAPSPHMIDPR